MKITITGATGFLGSHLAQGLLADGHQLTLLVRDPMKLLPELQLCRLILGDLEEPASLRAAVAGADAVVHCAAYVGEWGPPALYFRSNEDGTRHLIAACVAGGVKRFIHISSNSVYGDGTGDHVDLPEETPYRLTGRPYGDSKIAAERLVFAAHQAGEIVATAIRPSMIWGPRDRQFLPKIIDSLAKGMMIYLGSGQKLVGLTHVENIVALVRLCLTNTASYGRAYNIDDDDRRTQEDLVRALCARLGYKEPKITLPTGPDWVLAEASEFLWTRLKKQTPPLLTKMAVATLGYDNDVSVQRAKRELGYAPQDLFEARLDAYVASYRRGE